MCLFLSDISDEMVKFIFLSVFSGESKCLSYTPLLGKPIVSEPVVSLLSRRNLYVDVLSRLADSCLEILKCKSCTFCCWQAEQKAQEESERLRQQEREAMAEKRRIDLVLSNILFIF